MASADQRHAAHQEEAPVLDCRKHDQDDRQPNPRRTRVGAHEGAGSQHEPDPERHSSRRGGPSSATTRPTVSTSIRKKLRPFGWLIVPGAAAADPLPADSMLVPVASWKSATSAGRRRRPGPRRGASLERTASGRGARPGKTSGTASRAASRSRAPRWDGAYLTVARPTARNAMNGTVTSGRGCERPVPPSRRRPRRTPRSRSRRGRSPGRAPAVAPCRRWRAGSAGRRAPTASATRRKRSRSR